MSKIIRAEEDDIEELFRQLSNLQEKDETQENYANAIIALAGIVAAQERRINRLTDRVNNIGLVIERNGKVTFDRFHFQDKKIEELETRIIDMGFPT